MAVNTLLHFFLTLLTSSLFQDVLPQCSLVVKIRFTTCPGRELESDLSRTICRNSPGSSNCPTGVPQWLSVGCPEDILAHRLYIPGNSRKWATEWGHAIPTTILQRWSKNNQERPFCVCHGGWSLEETLALWAATFLSNTHGEALGSLLMCSNCLHVTLITPNPGTSEVLDFPYFTPQNPESDNLSPA